MNLFNLFAKLGLDKTEYEQGIKDAKEQGKDFAEDTNKKIGIIATDAWVNLTSKVIEYTKRAIQAGLETINYADNIGDLAGKWGFTTKEIQEFDYWATMSGTNLESLLTGMRGLVNQAEAGAPAFEKLGIKVKNNDGTFKGQKQLFLETIDALNKVQDRTERNALQFEIFGRAGIELGQVISRDKEELEALSQQAEDFGIILEEKTIEKAGDLNDALDRLKLQGKSAFAGLITGAEGAEKALEEYLNNLYMAIDKMEPILTAIAKKIGKTILKAIFNALKEGIIGGVRMMAGEGWIWGEKVWDKYDSFGDWLVGGPRDYYPNQQTPSSIFESQSNMQTSNDNSNYNVEITMNSSNYTEQDAKVIADEVIKQIATKKQARG
jgi:hypothetical protein